MRGAPYPDEIKTNAVTLRERGRSLREISEALHIPQHTIHGWVHHVKLTKAHRQRLQAKSLACAARGRSLAVLAWQRKIERWKEDIRNQVSHLGALPFSDSNIAKLTCGLLYICEGGKYPAGRHLSFANSDPRMIKLFLTLLRREFPIDEEKFRARVMHRWDQDGEALRRFWSRVTGIPLNQCYRSYADRRTRGQRTRQQHYRGVCAVCYGSTALQYQLQAIGESVLDLAKEEKHTPRATRAAPDRLAEPPPPPYRTVHFLPFPEREARRSTWPLQRRRQVALK